MEQTKLVNLDLSATKGTTVQVNGDPNAKFTLDLSDFGIYNRLTDGLKQLYDIFGSMKDEMGEAAEDEDTEVVQTEGESPEDDATAEKNALKLIEIMKNMDSKMRNVVDYIFSAPVSDVCAPEGYMFDLIEGQLRFEYIINALTKLYENNLNKEFYQLKSRINSKLPQYIKGKR